MTSSHTTPKDTPLPKSLRVVLTVVVAVHLALVFSVASAPLAVDARPPDPSRRSVLWPLYHDAVHRVGPASDFFALYHAGAQVAQRDDPYGGRGRDQVTPYFFPYRYAPALAFAAGPPLLGLAPATAWRLWIVALEALLAAVIVRLWRFAPTREVQVFTALTLLLSTAYFLELHMGQFTFASVALVAMALVGERVTSRTAAFSAAAFMKVFPLVAAPALVRDRAGRVVVIAAIALVVLTNGPLFLVDHALWQGFSRNFATQTDGFNTGNFGFVYLVRLLGEALSGPWGATTWAAVARVLQVIPLGVASLAALRSQHRERVALGGATLVVAHHLGYPHVWEHHMSAVLVMALVMLASLLRVDGFWRRSSRVVAVATLALALPTTFALDDPTGLRAYAPRVLLVACKALPVLALFAVGVWELTRRRSEPSA